VLATPDDFKTFAPAKPSVTIFLYHVSINGERRNFPTAGGGLPDLPLDLRFLITPWTKTTRDAYLIIGRIAQLLYDRALLTFSDLQCSGVWSSNDTVEIMMESIPVEQHYDIWEPTEIPYKLSLAYLARVIGIEAEPATDGPPVINAGFQH
jgi:hypothetical protein